MEWNLLDDDVKNSQSISDFKRKLLAIIRPTKNPVYDVFDIEDIKKLTKLRVNFSALNEHKFRHNFECTSPACACGRGIENNEHFLLHCHRYDLMRRDLFRHLNDSGIDVNELDSKVLCHLILFGSQDLSILENRIIIEATISFVKATECFK